MQEMRLEYDKSKFALPSKPRRFLISLLIFCLVLLGCSATIRRGSLINTEQSFGHRSASQAEYTFEIIEYPSHDSPNLKIRIFEIPSLELYETAHFQRIVNDDNVKLGNGLLGTLGVASYLMILYTPKDVKNGDKIEHSKGERAFYIGSAIFCGLFALAEFAGIDGNQPQGEITEQSYKGLKKGQPIPASGKICEFVFRGLSTSKKLGEYSTTTDTEGYISIDMLNDARIYDAPAGEEYITVTSANLKGQYNLRCSGWLDPLRKITAGELNVRSGPSTNYPVIGNSYKGENYLEVDSRGNWAKINFKSGEGWIYKGLTELCYAKYTQPFPPELIGSPSFHEPNDNKCLDAEETAEVKLNLENVGKGIAFGVKVNVEVAEDIPGLEFKREYNIGQINPSEKRLITIPFSADIGIPTREVRVSITVTERNGFGLPHPLSIRFSTQKFQVPLLALIDYGIEDHSNQNGKVEPLEQVTVTARIKNRGRGSAKAVKANLITGEYVFLAGYSKKTFHLGDIPPGGSKDIQFTVYTNNLAKSVPLTLAITEAYGKFGKTENIDLPLNVTQKSTSDLVIRPQPSQPPSGPEPSPLTVDVDFNIPIGKVTNRKAVAVVIGNKNYQDADVPRVDYAINDASIICKYFEKAFGVKPAMIYKETDAKQSVFNKYFGTKEHPEGKLHDYVNPDGTSDVFVYYSGHGMPDPETKLPYLMPVDCARSQVAQTGYNLEVLYANLSDLPARSVTVIIDACFSGQSHGGPLLREISPVIIEVSPEVSLPNGIIFTSSQAGQVSTWYPEKKHGLFTYFFLKALQGSADSNMDNRITVGEMADYLQDQSEGVPRKARELHGWQQMPTYSGDRQKVLLEY